MALEDYVDLRPKGRYLIGDCPLCGKTDGFNYIKDKGVWMCWECLKGGDFLTFLMHHKGVSYTEALMEARVL